MFLSVWDLSSDLLCLSAATVRKGLPEPCSLHDCITLKVYWSSVWDQYWKNDKCLSSGLNMPVAHKRAGAAYSIFKWSNSTSPNGYFWMVLGASWSRIWNKWFPTKNWVEKDSACEGSLKNIWQNAQWLVNIFFLWQKSDCSFLYRQVAYYLIQIFKFSTEVMNYSNVGWKELWLSSTPISCL